MCNRIVFEVVGVITINQDNILSIKIYNMSIKQMGIIDKEIFRQISSNVNVLFFHILSVAALFTRNKWALFTSPL